MPQVLSLRPMPLVYIPEAFDDPEWLFELKYDGFRALAYIEGHRCRLISRRGHAFRSWPQLGEEIAHSIRANHAVLDGEIVCLKPDGGTNFQHLLFRRDWPFFMAFDLLSVEAEDPRQQPLIQRKRWLKRIMPRGESRSASFSISRVAGSTCSASRASATLRGLSGNGRRGVMEPTGS